MGSTLIENAQAVADRAFSDLQVAWVQYAAARERLALVQAHERWKELQAQFKASG